jgi:hypothetical protein
MPASGKETGISAPVPLPAGGPVLLLLFILRVLIGSKKKPFRRRKGFLYGLDLAKPQ